MTCYGRYEVITAATGDVVTTAEAKAWCSIEADDTTWDDMISELVDAAVDQAEAYLSRKLLNTTVEEIRPDFGPDRFPLALGGVDADNVTIQYYPQNSETLETFTAYKVDAHGPECWIELNYGVSWPVPDIRPDAVKITYTSGFGATAASVPSRIKTYIKSKVAKWYSNREDSAKMNSVFSNPTEAERWIYSYKLHRF